MVCLTQFPHFSFFFLFFFLPQKLPQAQITTTPAQGLVTILQVGWDGCFPCSTSEQTRPSIHGCCLGKGGPGLETFCGWRVFGFVQAACSRESLYFGGWCDLKILKPTDLKTSIFLAGGQKREVFVLKANLGKDCWVSSFTSPGEQNWKEKKGKQVIPALRWSFSLALLPQCFFLVIPPHLCMHPKKKPELQTATSLGWRWRNKQLRRMSSHWAVPNAQCLQRGTSPC